MMRMFWMLALLAGCTETAPSRDDCAEFEYKTLRHARPITCHMLWCNRWADTRGAASGMATLWCEE